MDICYEQADGSIFDEDGLSAHFVYVTPKIARQWLDRHVVNSNIKAFHVDRYFDDITAGRWYFTADPIKFDKNGNLIDGRHRLTAISRMPEDTEMLFLVVVGLEPESQRGMDIPAVRTAAENLTIRGVKNASFVAPIFKIVASMDSDGVYSRTRVANITKPQVEKYVEEHIDEVNELLDRQRILAGVKDMTGMRVTLLGVFFIHAYRKAPNHTDSFLQELYELIDLSPGDPSLVLARRLRAITSQNAKHEDIDLLATTFRAFNDYLAGRSIGNIIRPKGGWGAKNFPVLKVPARLVNP